MKRRNSDKTKNQDSWRLAAARRRETIIVKLNESGSLDPDEPLDRGRLPVQDLDLTPFWAKVDGYGADVRQAYPKLSRRLRHSRRELRGLSLQRRKKLELYLEVRLPRTIDKSDAEQIALDFGADKHIVEDAYRSGIITPAGLMVPDLATLGSSLDQGYLKPASEGGVDALFAWGVEGGGGQGVRVCLVDTGYEDHDDLPDLGEANSPATDEHGTEMAGILCALMNTQGYTGICHGAQVFVSSTWDRDVADAIRFAFDNAAGMEEDLTFLLRRGDVLALPLQSEGYLVEYGNPDVTLAIEEAMEEGIVVVEAAANTDYEVPSEGYSNAVIVSAGAYPGSAKPHSWLGRHGHGPRVDCQGWGEKVATTRVYMSPDYSHYTQNFGDTSAATGIVAGVVACLQGAVRRATATYGKPGGTPLAPSVVRAMLQEHGTPQYATDVERIGLLPDLRALLKEKVRARLYVRDSLADDGTAIRFGATQFDSPDILVFQGPLPFPQHYVQPNLLNRRDYGNVYQAGLPGDRKNHVYVRVHNRGARADSAIIYLLALPAAQPLPVGWDATPGQWMLLGQVEVPIVRPGELRMSKGLAFELPGAMPQTEGCRLMAVLSPVSDPLDLDEVAELAADYVSYRQRHHTLRFRAVDIV